MCTDSWRIHKELKVLLALLLSLSKDRFPRLSSFYQLPATQVTLKYFRQDSLPLNQNIFSPLINPISTLFLDLSYNLIHCCGCWVAQLCSTLCNPMDCSLPSSSVHGISQVRILEWVAISFSRGSSWPRIKPGSPALAGKFLTAEPPGKPTNMSLT